MDRRPAPRHGDNLRFIMASAGMCWLLLISGCALAARHIL